MAKIIGIDLGTSNSAAAVLEGEACSNTKLRRNYPIWKGVSKLCGIY